MAEKLYSETFLGLNICMYELSSEDMALIIAAFYKVWANLEKFSEAILDRL